MPNLGETTKPPLRALLLADRSESHVLLARHLTRECGITTDHITGPIDPRDMNRFNNVGMLIATPASLSRIDPGVSLRLLRQIKVVLLVSRARLLEAADFAPWADGFLFHDDGVRRFCTAVSLSLQAHALCPDYIGPGFTLDDARVEKLGDMSASELEVLDRLAEGDPNLDIADRLGLEEREVKYLVRSILTKLHFNNRTEAGVFALRFRNALHARRRQH
jgi:DNA-binding NarL/FixJ family response regulator